MKAQILVSTLEKNPETLPSLALILAFLNYQGIAIETQRVEPSEIARVTMGHSMAFAVKFQAVVFYNPMGLINYCQEQGHCRI